MKKHIPPPPLTRFRYPPPMFNLGDRVSIRRNWLFFKRVECEVIGSTAYLDGYLLRVTDGKRLYIRRETEVELVSPKTGGNGQAE